MPIGFFVRSVASMTHAKQIEPTAQLVHSMGSKQLIESRVTEAIEGAVCYLQQLLEEDGIDLADEEALAVVRLAAMNTTSLFA